MLALGKDEYRERVMDWAKHIAAQGMSVPGLPSSTAAATIPAPTSPHT
jgi:hypothetical protein